MCRLTKVLLLPLLQIPSGHHQVADAIVRWLALKNERIEFEKVELLSSFNHVIEKMVSQTYLNWIKRFPSMYAWLYRQLAYRTTPVKRDYHKGYEWLFLSTVRDIIDVQEPDIIICTHALPSYLCSKLKQAGMITQPVVNMYTDFFVNQLWGRDGIDLHFVPTHQVKEQILRYGNRRARVFVTGIPVDYVFHQKNSSRMNEIRHVLIAGGNIGVGMDPNFFLRLGDEEPITYTVLCGKNQRLYQYLLDMDCEYITPRSYVTSREEMKQLYDQTDAIITKPGGVTITEAIYSGLPIFIPTALPGQEEINRDYLFQQQMASPINLNQALHAQISQSLSDRTQQERWNNRMDAYLASLEWDSGLQSLMDQLFG